MKTSWFIQRNTNVYFENVVSDLLYTNRWQHSGNPAAIPSALFDWGFWNSGATEPALGKPTQLGELVLSGQILWSEGVIGLLSKRGGRDSSGHVEKPLVVLAKVFEKLISTGVPAFVTKDSFVKIMALDGYSSITDLFCKSLNNPPFPQPNGYNPDIWINALVGANLFIKLDAGYELAPLDSVRYFFHVLALFGENISAWPDKRQNPTNYATYMGSLETGMFEILNNVDQTKLIPLFPNLLPLSQKRFARTSVLDNCARQRIVYGAPGTGKSDGVNKEVKNYDNTIRTTFHPDSDYASFVGSYKPTMESRTKYGLQGQPIKVDGADLQEDVIVYRFVPQAFTNAYVQAWTKLANTPADETPEKQYLVIEEINRGNCAQVFGDLFQLLDRDDIGYSKYPIVPDADLAVFLHNWFTGKGEFVDENGTKKSSENVFQKAKENGTLETPAGTAKATWKDVLTGRKLILPPNLYIWATMNTSDQSLFPIDSAFKRRWEWNYVPISKPKNEDGTDWKDWKIEVEGKFYDWWPFLEAVNQLIGEVTESEDKKLGYFFVKAENGIVSAETFVNKVAFYLWNDVFKDYGFDRNEFNGKADGPDKSVVAKAKDGQIRFTDFFNPSGDPRTEVVERFLTNLGLNPNSADGAGSGPDQSADANGSEQVVPSPSPQVG